jgi:hypothetical protein
MSEHELRTEVISLRAEVNRLKSLIENQPRVTIKDIFDFYNNLITIEEDFDITEEYLGERERRYIKNWLESIGVGVEEKEAFNEG